MKFLFTRFPLTSAHGGAENQTVWLMEGLRARGHDVSFLGSCSILLRRTKESGIRDDELRIGHPPVTKFGAISFLWRKAKMRSALIEGIQSLPEKPDIIFMLSLSEKLLLTTWAADQGIKVLWIEHDRVGPWLTRNPWLPALKKASRHATIVCVSELSRRKYIGMGFDPERVVAIANGVRVLSVVVGTCESHVPTTTLHVGALARLSPEKGIDILLEAIADLPELSLTIVGTGPQESEIRRLIAEDTERLGLGIPRIELKKTVSDLPAFYSSLDVFVLPSSDHDPFGLVAAEAMMCGTPTIVTDACGIAGYVRDGIDALVVAAGSVSALTEAIRRIGDPEFRHSLGTHGQTTALERFSLERMIDEYEKIL